MLKGLENLNRQFRAIPKQVRGDITKSLEKSGDEMVSLAQGLAPVRDGDLKASIVATRGGQQTPVYSQPGGTVTVPEGAVVVTAGNSRVRYGHLVEFGTKPHPQGGQFEGTVHPGTGPRPFFWPAYRSLKKRIKNRTRRALTAAAKKVGRS